MRNLRQGRGFSVLEIVFVCGVLGVISAIALPMFEATVASYRLVGTARNLTNALAMAKVRAASSFTRVRLFVDLTDGTSHLELLDKTTTPPHWTVEDGTTSLPATVSFGFSSVTTPPPDSQDTIGQAATCTQDNGTAIAGTACVIFNSRGVPVNPAGVLVPDGALYITDNNAVFGVTVAATGMIRLWRTFPHDTASWSLQ